MQLEIAKKCAVTVASLVEIEVAQNIERKQDWKAEFKEGRKEQSIKGRDFALAMTRARRTVRYCTRAR